MWWHPPGDELPIWLAFVVACGLLVALVFLGNRRRQMSPVQAKAQAGEVHCGQCGYDVRGLPGDTCPECGSDLNKVGRFSLRFRRWQKMPPLLRLVGWTVGCLLVFGFFAKLYDVRYRPETTRWRNVVETYFQPTGGESGELLMVRSTKSGTEFGRRNIETPGGSLRRVDREIELHRPSADRLNAALALRMHPESEAARLPDGKPFLPVGETKLFGVVGEEESLDATDWPAVLEQHADESLSDEERADLEKLIVWESASSRRQSEIVLDNPDLRNSEWAGDGWDTFRLYVTTKQGFAWNWRPMAWMGTAIGLTWLTGLAAVLRRRPIKTNSLHSAAS